ncbi:MAG: glucose 1-dehydrogenase [Gammaproteobacteria bacterium]|jgi:NAD(P)-dependent dehydrogenase (short-subunit alcohol dehydrogenase family)|nr:glucose 1-dehydrogenase [Gammaproteobacteria bacterium]
MNYNDLEGKVAVINGASRGIGEAIARGMAACGAQLVLSSRQQDGVQAVADSINSAGGRAVAQACHAGHLDEIDALFAFVREKFGRLDILVNNAATNPYYGPATGLPPEAFDKTVDVNLKGPYYLTSGAIPLMIESGGGSVVNVASIAALTSLPGQAVYSMTKAGLVNLTRSFAKEYGQQGVRVNAILPGVVETRFAAALVEDPSVQKWMSRLPIPRAGQPEDMVAGVLYLVSDHAAYTTGTTLVMDGGATLG